MTKEILLNALYEKLSGLPKQGDTDRKPAKGGI